MLPWMLDLGNGTGEKMYWLHLGKNGPNPAIGSEWTIFYEERYDSEETPSDVIPWPTLDADTEADARAKMLVYLLEHDIIQSV